MKTDYKFWIQIVIYSGFMLALIWFTFTPGQPKSIMAEDGTQCIYFKSSIDCNFELRNFNTQFGEFPMAVNPEKEDL